MAGSGAGRIEPDTELSFVARISEAISGTLRPKLQQFIPKS